MKTLQSLKRLLGSNLKDKNVASFNRDYASLPLTSWQHNDDRIAATINGQQIGVEEGMAMILQHSLLMAREHARALNGLDTPPSINDIVLTAPEWYTSSQRDLLVQLAKIAGEPPFSSSFPLVCLFMR
jgi:molecular chaperone DnaK (HSP70)